VRREGQAAPPPPRTTPHASPLTPHPKIALVAGEASGDLLGSLLIEAVQAAGIDADFFGIAGPHMQARGARSLCDMETLAVRGYVEVLSNLGRILAIRRALKRQLLTARPRLFVGIDAPDFNLSLETHLRRAGIPTVHFVSPSIWAWRGQRIEKIRRAAKHLLLIFPFEEAIYRQAGIPATYVGHPLAHALPQPDRSAARQRLGLAAGGEYLALLPGSRQGEIVQLGGLMLEASKRIVAERPDVRILVPLASLESEQLFWQALDRAQAHDLPIQILPGQAHDVLQAADCALIASGTATLEALLLGCPHVITYRVPWLTYRIMRRQAYLPWIGLPNILATRTVVPELLQERATPEALAQAVLDLLADDSAREAMRVEFRRLRGDLTRDTPRLIAGALRPFLA